MHDADANGRSREKIEKALSLIRNLRMPMLQAQSTACLDRSAC
jgi:hypothetical protein